MTQSDHTQNTTTKDENSQMTPTPSVTPAPTTVGATPTPSPTPAPAKKKSKLWSFIKFSFFAGVIAALAGVLIGGYAILSAQKDLPSLDTLKDYHPNNLMQVFTDDGKLIGEYGVEKRIPVTYDEVPEHLINAVIAIEDSRFKEHNGVDYYGLGRAVVNNITNRSELQGASTITQQLAKNFYLSNERTFSRKFYEALMAYKIESELTKNQIMERYLNLIYLGQHAYGVGAASKVYFDKNVQDLTIAESAVLAALPQAPSTNNPIRNPDQARIRKEYILLRMNKLGFISDADYQAALAEKLTFVSAESKQLENQERRDMMDSYHAGYVADMARELIYTRFKEQAYSAGLKVYTTINSEDQIVAHNAVQKAVRRYDGKYGYRGSEELYEDIPTDPVKLDTFYEKVFDQHLDIEEAKVCFVLSANASKITCRVSTGSEIEVLGEGVGIARRFLNAKKNPIKRGAVIRINQVNGKNWHVVKIPSVQSAFIALNPHDGAIRSLVGGYDYRLSRFNRAAKGYRQPGSTIKPFIYASAMEKNKMTPNSIVSDTPIKMGRWRPKNADGRYLGPIPLTTALASSRNMVSIRLLQSVGNDYFRSFAERFGFEGQRIDQYATVALGAIEATPLQLAGAYCTIANGGYRVNPYLISKVVDQSGNVLMQAQPMVAEKGKGSQIISSRVANSTVSLMKGVVAGGTGKAAQAAGSGLAGKTGTTNDARDAWFAGFGKNLVGIAWMGFDKPESLGVGEFGGGLALPIWVDYMKTALYRKTTQSHMLNTIEEAEEPKIVIPKGKNEADSSKDTESLTDTGTREPPKDSDVTKASEAVNQSDAKAAADGKAPEPDQVDEKADEKSGAKPDNAEKNLPKPIQ